MDAVFNLNHYPTYNVGDRVTIRQWDDMAAHAQDKLLIHPKKTVSHQLVPCFILNLFLPSERINHYDQTYLHPRYHQRYCLL